MAENKKLEIESALNSWCSAVKTRVPENVVEHYAEDGVLWGTVSPVIRPGHELIREYFIHFLSKEDIQGEVTDQNIRVYGDIAINSGSYIFSWKAKGSPVSAEARFSFVYKKDNGKWLIVDHHSSFKPE